MHTFITGYLIASPKNERKLDVFCERGYEVNVLDVDEM